MGFASFSSDPELASKIKLFFALAPVYTLGYCSEFIRTAAYVMYPALVRKRIKSNYVAIQLKSRICVGLERLYHSLTNVTSNF